MIHRHWFVGFLIHWVIDSSVHMFIERRKFRSQTSDLWTDVATVVRAVREEKEPEERRSKCRKCRNGAKHCVFPILVAPEGRKVGSLKRQVRSHVAGWEIKNCMLLWWEAWEAHLEVKKRKAPHVRSSLAAEMSKRCLQLWREEISKSKFFKHLGFGPLLEISMIKKCTRLWARRAIGSQNVIKNTSASDHLWKLRGWKSARCCWRKAHFKWKL